MLISPQPPFGGAAPADELLARSPLVRVIIQVRFASVMVIETRSGVASFQDRIRRNYPLFDQVTAQGLHVDVTPNGHSFRTVETKAWRFRNPEQTSTVTLSSDAISLETTAYVNRTKFLNEWTDLLECLEDTYSPSLAVRVGVRYFNRIEGEDVAQLTKWIKPNLIGLALPEHRDHVTQAISEANVNIEEGTMLLRWGILPPGSTIDPSLAPVATPSWILDIDASSDAQRSFSAGDLARACLALSARAYAVFHWTMTDEGRGYFQGAT